MSLYKTDDLIWCWRCEREESVGAVFHDGPYTEENSHLVTPAAERDKGSHVPAILGNGRYQTPACSCGWRGQETMDVAFAKRQADEHSKGSDHA